MTLIRRSLLITVFLSLPALTVAQSTSSPTASASAGAKKLVDYSKEGVVIEKMVNNVSFEADGTGVREVSVVAHVQDDAGVKQLAVLSFAYTSASQALDVDYVRVRKPDGTVVNTPDYNIQDMPADVTRVAPMYSDIHEKHVTVKALGVGDTLEYQLRFRTVKPEFKGQFWFEYAFTKDAVCKDEQLRIRVPKDMYVNISSPDLQPAITEEGNRRIYTWKTANLAREVQNPKEIPRREIPRPSVELSTFRNWQEVGHWYNQLQKPQLVVTPAIQAKADEITKGLTTNDAKLRAIYKYVSTHFHYVSLSFGIGRYQPHSADDVLGNEYGDCKDKHTLFATMLKAVGIDAWPVLINASRKIDSDIASPADFNHVITAVPEGNKIVWLDTTAEVAPFGLILTTLRDKQALVIPTTGEPSLMTTSVTLPFPFVQSFEANGTLDNHGTFTGHMDQISRGDTEVLFRIGFRQVPQAQWKDLIQRISYSLGFGGDVSDVTATAPDDTSKPFEFSYHYVRKKYSDWDNHRITPPMPPFGVEVPDTDERKPVEPYYLGAPGEIVYRARIELPAFCKAQAPNNVDLVEDFADYHSRYSINHDVLTAERRMIIKKSEVALTAWDRYVKFRKEVSDDENRWIDLNGSKASTAAVNIAEDNREAGPMFREAVIAFRANDFAKSRGLLTKLIELDPKYPRAHILLAEVDFADRDGAKAEAEILKEEAANPQLTESYVMLARLYAGMRRPDDALKQWRKLLKVDPGNQEAAFQASYLLMRSKQYDQAVAILEPAVKASPGNSTLAIQLGGACLKAGQKDKGIEIIEDTVNENTSANDLNTAAWALAEADADLQRAKEFSERSIQTVIASSNSTTFSDRDGVMQSNLFAACWDTLGWIYFRLNDLPKAVSYLRSGWMLSQDPVIGDHLAQVYQKLGNTREAEHLYLLALAAVATSGTNPSEIRAHYQQLTGKRPNEAYASHRLPNGTWTLTPGEELSRMRTAKLHVRSHPTGSATFSVVVADGKIQKVQFLSGSPALKAISEAVKTARLDMPFPVDAHSVQLVRHGMVTCGSAGCDFTLLLPQNSFAY